MSETKGKVLRDSKGLPIDGRGWPIMEVVDYDPVAEKAKREVEARLLAEHQRLRDSVVDTAKHERRVDLAIGDYWRKREVDPDYDPDSAALFALVNDSGGLAHNNAVDALLAFEAEAEGRSR